MPHRPAMRTNRSTALVATALLLCASSARAQNHSHQIESWTSNATAAAESPPPPPVYTVGTYSSLTEELAAHQHSRFTIQLKPGHDLLEIILKLLDWKEQDVEQLWIRPAQHIDRDRYDIETPSGMEAALLTFMRKARNSTDEEAVLQFTNPHSPEGQQTKTAVLDMLQKLRSSGQIVSQNGRNSVSWRVPGEYKIDLRGDVNVLRKALVDALQQSPGIESAHIDEHYIRSHHPAWYEVSAEPWDI